MAGTIQYSTPFFPQGVVGHADFTPAAAAYLAGDIMGTIGTFRFTHASNGSDVPQGSLIRVLSAVTKIDVAAVPAGETTFGLQMYSRVPTVQNDNDPWALLSADLPYYRGSLALGAPVDLPAASTALYVRTAMDILVPLEAEEFELFGYLVTDGPNTPTAVARKVILYGMAI